MLPSQFGFTTVLAAATVVFAVDIAGAMRLIRFGGHLSKGEYDVHTDGRDDQKPASPPTV
jgi:hypothetical protein